MQQLGSDVIIGTGGRYCIRARPAEIRALLHSRATAASVEPGPMWRAASASAPMWVVVSRPALMWAAASSPAPMWAAGSGPAPMWVVASGLAPM